MSNPLWKVTATLQSQYRNAAGDLPTPVAKTWLKSGDAMSALASVMSLLTLEDDGEDVPAAVRATVTAITVDRIDPQPIKVKDTEWRSSIPGDRRQFVAGLCTKCGNPDYRNQAADYDGATCACCAHCGRKWGH